MLCTFTHIAAWTQLQEPTGKCCLLCADKNAKFSVLGFVEVPMLAAPFASLALTSIIFPQASFLGHLSGIAVGLLVSEPSVVLPASSATCFPGHLAVSCFVDLLLTWHRQAVIHPRLQSSDVRF